MDNIALRNLTYIIAEAAAAQIELAAMREANAVNRELGIAPRYSEKDFMKLIERHGIHHNAVLSMEWGY